MVLATKREASKLGISGFSLATEDDIVVLVKDNDRCFFKEDVAVVITQFSDAHQVVMEVRHYVTALYGDLWEEEVA